MSKDITAAGLKKKIDALKVGERLILQNVPDHIYHQSSGIGSTLLKAAMISMAHYKAARDKKKLPTKAQQKIYSLGSATHTLVLEPELWESQYIVQPTEIKVRRGKVWDAFQEKHAGMTIITHDQMEAAGAMAEAVMDQCGKWFMDGKPELSYWYRHETGIVLKARVDYQKGDAIIDLKTTKEETPSMFAYKVKKYYDVQDALYRMVTGLADMVFVGVEKEAPHSVFLSKTGTLLRQRSTIKLEKMITKQFAFAIETNEFPFHPLEIVEAELTPYEQDQMQPKQVA